MIYFLHRPSATGTHCFLSLSSLFFFFLSITDRHLLYIADHKSRKYDEIHYRKMPRLVIDFIENCIIHTHTHSHITSAADEHSSRWCVRRPSVPICAFSSICSQSSNDNDRLLFKQTKESRMRTAAIMIGNDRKEEAMQHSIKWWCHCIE